MKKALFTGKRVLASVAIATAFLVTALPVSAKVVSVSAGQACSKRNALDKASKLICMPTKGVETKLTWQTNSPDSDADGVGKTIKIGWMGDITGPTVTAIEEVVRGNSVDYT